MTPHDRQMVDEFDRAWAEGEDKTPDERCLAGLYAVIKMRAALMEKQGRGMFMCPNKGKTLRDEFAMAADVSCYSPKETLEEKQGKPVRTTDLSEYIAHLRYLEADAMLIERAKEQK